MGTRIYCVGCGEEIVAPSAVSVLNEEPYHGGCSTEAALALVEIIEIEKYIEEIDGEE